MNKEELLNDKKTFNNSKAMLKDLLAGDPKAEKMFEDLNLDINAIRTALTFLTQDNNLSDVQKLELLENSWKVNFRAAPPTPEEFLTEKYIGYTAKSLYPRVKKAFKEFLNPSGGYRNLILYPHIGW